MTEQEKKWFEKVIEDNTDDWKTFSKPKHRGWWKRTINQYNDTAHFVYELLQNADDAEAKEVKFELHRDKLIFTHNGSIRFSVSNPENIEEDRKNGKLGHVNAITYFYVSNKETDSDIKQNKIGKFGIGFKSVYRYTSTPYIYDDNICFKIENMMIPSIIEDTSLLQKGKTVFVIPFNSDHITAEDAYSEIKRKLRTLNCPQLFLNNIRHISWKADNESGSIKQTIVAKYPMHDCHAERLSIADNGEQSSIIKISRDVELSEYGSHRISIVYYLDKEGRINTATKRRIYCFFPVSESINTCFALHAPFMLTENRQNLLPDNPVNKQLLKELAKLAADSLLVLRDIRLKEDKLLLDDRLKKLTESNVKQLSNWDALVEETLFEKEYKNVFESENIFLSSKGQYLYFKDTYWATSEMRSLISVEQLKELTERKDFCLCSCTNYLSEVKGLGIDELTDNKLNDKLSVEFLQNQTDEWLDKFYMYLYDKRLVGNKLENGKKQKGVFRDEPIFKTDAKTFVAAFYKNEQKQLFKYTEGVTTPNNSVNQKLLEKSEGLRLLVKELDIKEADKYDYIQQRLKEEQREWSQEGSNKFLAMVIRYWKSCGDDDKNRLLSLLKTELLLKCDKLFDNDKSYYKEANKLYRKSQLIEDYYLSVGTSYKYYLDSTTYGDKKKKELVAEVQAQCILDEEYYFTTVAEIGREDFNEFIDWLGIACYPRIVRDDKNGYIIDSITRIVYIMPMFTHTEWQDKMSHTLWEVLCYYVGKRGKDISRMSYKYTDLKYKHDFYDKNLLNILKSQPWLFINGKLMRLSDDVYWETLVHEEYNGDGSDKLMNMLGIEKRPSQSTDGLEILANILQIDSRQNESSLQKIKQLLEEALNKTKEETISGETDTTTVEELTLEEQAKSTEKYSYKWLCLLMTAEAMISGEDDEEKKTKAVKIEFRSIVKEGDIIILDNPSRNVPASLEDVDNLEVKFYNRDDSYKSITFDAASVKDNNMLLLKVKNKQRSDIEALQIPNLSYAAISVEHPIELARNWKRLIDGYAYAGYHDTFSFQKEIRSDLNFIFGPPGTGKTYTLAERIISMIENGAKRILVLTPTNKACDVITQEVIKHSDGDCSWLYRFVKTMEEDLENYVLFHDTEIRTERACIVSTIARYAYDYCAEGNLKDLDWDYVIVDEASMIPLYQIVAPIFNDKTHNILIAGDPFQIQPIVRSDGWKDENIYTMLGLNDFENPQTYPVNSEIETLKTQYRAVPDIGELFSRYSYKGILQHNRTAQAQRKLDLGLDAKALNLITFPCSKESQFCPLKLKSSNIQVYSVIFVVEFLRYISNKISGMNLERQVNIGVVGPYIAEIQAINKMQEQLVPHHDNVSIICGSAHGFQGDECDIVIAIMNPPASGLIRKTQQTFINNKNILNVSVSRAKDYLFVVMPDSEYTYSDKLLELNELKKIITDIGCKQYSNRELERIMFGRDDEIEENTFVTSHQMANVYSEFSKKYEIRIDENAIDIQVNGNEGRKSRGHVPVSMTS